MIIHHKNLRNIAAGMVAAAGSTDAEPRLVADNLVYANLTGHDSHGVGMLPNYMESVRNGELHPNQHARIASDHGAMVVIDGQAGYGQVIGKESMEIGIARAREHGVCVLAIRNSYHLCRIGAWGEQCSAAGMVSINHVNGIGHAPLVAPFQGTDARYSTNPWCCTMPATDNNPALVADFATSVIAMGKVRVAHNRGETLPDGILFDAQGQETNDPAAMYTTPRGAIRPVGEHKGYCLALLNELLAGALTGGGTNRPQTLRTGHTIINNMLSIIIDPQRLTDKAAYDAEIDAALSHVKASPPRNASDPVLAPGDPERQTMKERMAEGIPIDDRSWQQLRDAAALAGMADERFLELMRQPA